VHNIVAREGISGLYSGLSSALFGISVTNFVYYYWYEWTRAFFEAAAARAGRASKKLTTVESMIAGAIAGSATVILTNPIWVVNTRMTARKNASGADEADAAEQGLAGPGADGRKKSGKPSTVGTLLSLLRTEVPRALFAGVVPALVLVINPILQYTLFEQLKNMVEKRRRVTPTVAFFLGALGKLFATTVTYPYITVKSQMHVAKAGEKKEGVTEAIRRVVREEGYAGLYKGMCFLPANLFSSGMLSSSLLFHGNRQLTTMSPTRYRPQGHPERADGRLPVCLQGRALRVLRPVEELRC
jgi:adenine nucleotide transporter 17